MHICGYYENVYIFIYIYALGFLYEAGFDYFFSVLSDVVVFG